MKSFDERVAGITEEDVVLSKACRPMNMHPKKKKEDENLMGAPRPAKDPAGHTTGYRMSPAPRTKSPSAPERTAQGFRMPKKPRTAQETESLMGAIERGAQMRANDQRLRTPISHRAAPARSSADPSGSVSRMHSELPSPTDRSRGVKPASGPTESEDNVGIFFTRSTEETLAKSRMLAIHSTPERREVANWIGKMDNQELAITITKALGIETVHNLGEKEFVKAVDWAESKVNSHDEDVVIEALRKTLPKDKLGGAWVAGKKPGQAKVNYAKLVGLKAQIKIVQAHLNRCEDDTDKTIVLQEKLKQLQEEYDYLTQCSAGLGLITEELVPSDYPAYDFNTVRDYKEKSLVIDEVNDDLSKAFREIKAELKRAGVDTRQTLSKADESMVSWKRGRNVYTLSKWRPKAGPANPDLKRVVSQKTAEGAFQVSANKEAERVVKGKKHAPNGGKLAVAHGKTASMPAKHDETSAAPTDEPKEAPSVKMAGNAKRHQLGARLPGSKTTGVPQVKAKPPELTDKYGKQPKLTINTEGSLGIKVPGKRIR